MIDLDRITNLLRLAKGTHKEGSYASYAASYAAYDAYASYAAYAATDARVVHARQAIAAWRRLAGLDEVVVDVQEVNSALEKLSA